MRWMSSAPLLLLVACKADTGLSSGGDTTDFVAGDGGMTLDPAALEIVDCEVGFGQDGVINISSVGENDLIITDVRITSDESDVFYIEDWEETLTFAPGAEPFELRVVATLDDAVPAYGSLRITSNDPTQNRADVPLSALPTGWDDGNDTGDTGGGGGDTDTGSSGGDTGADSGGGDTGTSDTGTDTGAADTGDSGS